MATSTQLFADVHRLVREDEDYAKAIKVLDKILHLDPGNGKALHSTAVCLIRVGQFEDALKAIGRMDAAAQRDVSFEKAYCLYRLNRVEEALDLLLSLKSQEQKIRELMAQALYRLERFEESYACYVDLIKNCTDDCEDERETNLSAVMASISLTGGVIEGKPEIGEQSYELCYNKSCIHIGQGQYQQAKDMLSKSEELCVKLMREEEQTEEEIEVELGIIHAQIGYVNQLLGKEQIALQLYNQVLKSKPDDPALIAVVSNNVVTINKDQNVFDSKKKIRAALSEDAKLSSLQKKTIATNNCLFLMLTGQTDACRKQIEALKDKYADAESELILAGLLVREKEFNEAITVLQSVAEKSLNVSLTLCQLLLKQGRVSEAISLLNGLQAERNRLGILSTIVSLLLSLGDRDAAISVLKEAISWHKINNQSQDSLIVLYRETSKLLIQQNRAQEAAVLLEEQRRLAPDNPRVIAQLIAAYSQFDQKKADETMKCLPPIDTIIDSVDVNALEESNWSLGAKYVKKTVKTDASATGVKSEAKKKGKRKRKRKGKNYDTGVDPDPERWLPKWQRAQFRKKKDKRKETGIGKGSQGAVADASEAKPSPKSGAGSGSAGHQSPQSGPRQQQQCWQKKKKSKR